MPIVVINKKSEEILSSLGKKFFLNARISDVLNCDFDAKLAEKFKLNFNKKAHKNLNIEQIQCEAKVIIIFFFFI